MKYVMFAVLMMLAPHAIAQDASPQITVTGQGIVDTAPDMATITLGVTSQAETASDALTQTSTATASVLERLTQAGIESRDVQTSGLSLSPQWENRRDAPQTDPTIIGFVASNNVTVRVRDLAILGEVLDAAVRDGANTFNGLQFGLQKPRPAEDEARRKAVADARAKAELYAEAAGVTLGPIQSITENQQGGGPRPMYRMEAAMSDSSVPISEGEISVDAAVTIVWELAAE